MKPNEVPPNVFVQSALQACAKAQIEATIVYTVHKADGRRVTAAMSNKGPEGLARAANALKFGDGAIERAAAAMHGYRLKFGGDMNELPEDVRAEMAKCFVCHLSDPWEQLDDVDKEGHRELTKVVLGAAVAQVATQPLVSV